MPNPVFVYVIECAGYVKIGVAADPNSRARSLNTGSPVKAVVFRSKPYDSRDSAMQVERRLHRHFAKSRANGEWFDITPEQAWRALSRLDTPKPRVEKKSHHVGPDYDNLALEELRAAMNATEAAYYPKSSRPVPNPGSAQ